MSQETPRDALDFTFQAEKRREPEETESDDEVTEESSDIPSDEVTSHGERLVFLKANIQIERRELRSLLEKLLALDVEWCEDEDVTATEHARNVGKLMDLWTVIETSFRHCNVYAYRAERARSEDLRVESLRLARTCYKEIVANVCELQGLIYTFENGARPPKRLRTK